MYMSLLCRVFEEEEVEASYLLLEMSHRNRLASFAFWANIWNGCCRV